MRKPNLLDVERECVAQSWTTEEATAERLHPFSNFNNSY